MKINSCCVFSSSWPRLVSKWLENLGTDRLSHCDKIDNQSLILICLVWSSSRLAYIGSPMEDNCHVSSACYWCWQFRPAQLWWRNPGAFITYLLQLQESSSVITGIIISHITIITWTKSKLHPSDSSSTKSSKVSWRPPPSGLPISICIVCHHHHHHHNHLHQHHCEAQHCHHHNRHILPLYYWYRNML